MKLNPCGTNGEVARITRRTVCRAAVQCRTGRRENERHKGVVTQAKKAKTTPQRRRRAATFCSTGQQQARTEGQLAAAKLPRRNDGSA